MKNKGLLSDAVGLLAIALMLGPWLVLAEPGWGTYLCTLVGAALGGISRADSLSDVLGRGNPGDDFIRDTWVKLKGWFSKKKL